MSDDSGLRDQLLEKNEMSYSYNQVSDLMTVEEQYNEITKNGSLQTKDSKYVYYNFKTRTVTS